jgi:magnesium transporter
MIQSVGLSPGEPIYTGNRAKQFPNITILRYSVDQVTLRMCKSVEDLQDAARESRDPSEHTWIHIEPISDETSIAQICEMFSIHQLVTEDILGVKHRPKIEEYEEYTFGIFKYVEYKEILYSSQIALVLFDGNTLISFADTSPERFQVIHKRLEKRDSKIRKEGTHYLFFSLIDYLVDEYFVVLETLGERIELLEDEIINNPVKESIQKIHDLKRTLIELKKSIWPMREIINFLLRSDKIEHKYHIYFKDTYDHIINTIDIIEGYHDSISGFLDIYLSTLGNRMNEIMKTLSIISTIFIPLSFLTGYFGMNFKYETIFNSQPGYLWTNVVMFVIPIVLLLYFRLRRWF